MIHPNDAINSIFSKLSIHFEMMEFILSFHESLKFNILPKQRQCFYENFVLEEPTRTFFGLLRRKFSFIHSSWICCYCCCCYCCWPSSSSPSWSSAACAIVVAVAAIVVGPLLHHHRRCAIVHTQSPTNPDRRIELSSSKYYLDFRVRKGLTWIQFILFVHLFAKSFIGRKQKLTKVVLVESKRRVTTETLKFQSSRKKDSTNVILHAYREARPNSRDPSTAVLYTAASMFSSFYFSLIVLTFSLFL